MLRTLLFLFTAALLGAEPARIHVFVALADNRSQGIAPVPARIGDGDRPEENLYWGCSEALKPVFKASALKGEGVLETFFGLLHLTWTRLEAEHQLSRSLGLEADEFLPVAARKLGIKRDVQSLLASCLGNGLKPPSREVK